MEGLDLCPHLKSMNFLLEIIFMVCIVELGFTAFYYFVLSSLLSHDISFVLYHP